MGALEACGVYEMLEVPAWGAGIGEKGAEIETLIAGQRERQRKRKRQEDEESHTCGERQEREGGKVGARQAGSGDR